LERELFALPQRLPIIFQHRGHGTSAQWRSRIFFRETAFSAGAFTAAIYLYFLTANWGVQDYLIEGPLKEYLSNPAIHVQHVVTGVMFGVILSVVNRLAERSWLRNRSFGLLVLVRSTLYLAGLGLVAGAVVLFFLATPSFSFDSLLNLLRAFSPRHLISIGIWLALVVIGVNFLQEISRLVGQGHLWRLLRGYYRLPRDEERVFLFMDLKASTTTAERLGHRKYSEFIQECFQDLTMVVLKHGGTIYQYVGDEVVMTWPAVRAESLIHSVQAFFAYERVLAEKGASYRDRFGVAPVFRGGIDVGSVMVTEVGEMKRSIAYHGDPLNTASRLLDLCKERGGRLLVSAGVGEAVAGDPTVQASWQDEVMMKGKLEPTVVLSLEPGPALHPPAPTPSLGLGVGVP
jgi:adenylate cyclase